MQTLVVYFSRTGTTKQVAESIAKALGADIEAIQESRDRRGLRGYVRSAFDAVLSRWVPIEPLDHDPARYDLVVVGSPVWAGNLSAPVRAFLSRCASQRTSFAFFVTMGGRGDRKVLNQMSEVPSVTPVATLALTQHNVLRGSATAEIDAFVASISKIPASVLQIS